jgi:cation diffusion facilitator CzcD-associated flavoprotein CzcO
VASIIRTIPEPNKIVDVVVVGGGPGGIGADGAIWKSGKPG